MDEARVLGRRIEMTVIRADGSEFPVELAITRIPSDGPPSFTGYVRDITARKRSEAELRPSGGILAEAQRLSSTGSFSWRVDKDEMTWSEELYRIFEFDPGVSSIFSRTTYRFDDAMDHVGVQSSGGERHDQVLGRTIKT